LAEQGILAGEQGVYRPKLKSSPDEIFGTKSLWEMFALPPKADLCSALAHVRFVPKADMRLLHIRSESQCLAAEKRETDFEMNSI